MLIKRFITAVVLGTALAFSSGCAMFEPVDPNVAIEESLPAPVKVVKQVIFESRILMTAVAQTYKQELDQGIVTPAQAHAMGEKLAGYAKDLDTADELVDAGDILGAKSKADLVHKAVVALHKQIVKKANQ